MYIASICNAKNTIRIIEFNINGFNYSKELFISCDYKEHVNKEVIKYFNNEQDIRILTNDVQRLNELMPKDINYYIVTLK